MFFVFGFCYLFGVEESTSRSYSNLYLIPSLDDAPLLLQVRGG